MARAISRYTILCVIAVAAGVVAESRVQLRLDRSEASDVIAIARQLAAGRSVSADLWRTLFESAPYRLLQEREASTQHPISDREFRAFVESDAVVGEAESLGETLAAWSRADLNAIATRVLSYLPPTAKVSAIVCLVIKPAANSFVWRAPADAQPTMFISVNRALSEAQFANKVAHEAHHIGVDSLAPEQDRLWGSLPPEAKRAARWLGGFGEGEAMLAAAGGPGVHPRAVDGPAAERAWDADMAHFARDVDALQAFFFDILDGSLATPAEIRKRAEPFYGAQGPWYTVGYRMAVIVERRFGRPALLGAILDPRQLLVLYNRATTESNAAKRTDLPLWSPALLRRLNAS